MRSFGLLLLAMLAIAATCHATTAGVERRMRVELKNGKEWVLYEMNVRQLEGKTWVSFSNQFVGVGAFEELEAVERINSKHLQDMMLGMPRFHEVSTNNGGQAESHAENVALLSIQESLGNMQDLSQQEREELSTTNTNTNTLPEFTLKFFTDPQLRYIRLVDVNDKAAAVTLFKAVWEKATGTLPTQPTQLDTQSYLNYVAATKEMWAALKPKYPSIVSIAVRYTLDVTGNITLKNWFIGADVVWDPTTYPENDYAKTRDTIRTEALKLMSLAALPNDKLLVSWVGTGEALINKNLLNLKKQTEQDAATTTDTAKFDPFKYGGATDPPMVGGINTGYKNSFGGMGTLGGFLIRHPAVLEDDAFDVFALSNAHIWQGVVGTEACQPSEALFKFDAPTGLGNRACEGLTAGSNKCCQQMGRITAHRVNIPKSALNNVFNVSGSASLNPTLSSLWNTNPLATNNNLWPTATNAINPMTGAPASVVNNRGNTYDPRSYIRDFAAVKLDLDTRYKFRCAIRELGPITGTARYAGYSRRHGIAFFDGDEFEFHDPTNFAPHIFLTDVLKYGSRTHLTGGRLHEYFPRSQFADYTVVGRRTNANPRAMPISFAPQQIFTDPAFPGSIVGNGDIQFIKDIREHFIKSAPLPQFHHDPTIDALNKTTLFNELWYNNRILSVFAFTGDSGALVSFGSEVLGQIYEAVWVSARPDSEVGLPGDGMDHAFPCVRGPCPAFGAAVQRDTVTAGRQTFHGFYLKTRVMSIDYVVDEVNESLKVFEGRNFQPVSLCTEYDRAGYVSGRTDAVCEITGPRGNRRCGPRPLCGFVNINGFLYCRLRTDL